MHCRCADAGAALSQPISIRHEYTRLEDKTMRVQWHIHKKWLTKIQWIKTSQMRSSRIHAVLTATCHTRLVTNGKRVTPSDTWEVAANDILAHHALKSNGGWQSTNPLNWQKNKFNLTGLAYIVECLAGAMSLKTMKFMNCLHDWNPWDWLNAEIDMAPNWLTSAKTE